LCRVCIDCDSFVGCLTIECLLQIPNTDYRYVEDTEQDPSMISKKVLHVQSVSEWAPACIGPYSQATVMCNVIRSAGQIALLPQTMSVNEPTLKPQMIQCLNNVHETLTALKSCIHNVVRCVVYVDMNQVPESDRPIVESTDTWNEFLQSKENDYYVSQYQHRDLPKLTDLFRVVYVSKLPKSSAVEYHTTSINNRVDSVTASDVVTESLGDGISLRAQAITVRSANSYTHLAAIHILNAEDTSHLNIDYADKILSVASSIIQQRGFNNLQFILCRVFVCQENMTTAERVQQYLKDKNITVSMYPCHRIALQSQAHCTLSCEFEAFK
jgi:enamine deaminase RidA (YjgF/YER057c/UK114 family)